MSAVTVLGYLQPCANCGVSALLSEQTEGWTCPVCSGEEPDPDNPIARAAATVRQFYEGLIEGRESRSEGALLDAVDTLDDEDPGPVQLAPEVP